MPQACIASKLSRIAWTVRYLRARQIAGQVRHRMMRSFEWYGNANEQAVAEYPGCAWPRGVRFLAPGAQDSRAVTAGDGSWEFLNSRVRMGFPPRWDGPELPKLWQYNLHYFEWLWALEYEEAKEVVLDWIQKHPLAKDAVGWEPYPTSLRLINWCAVFWGRFRARTESDAGFVGQLWQSVYQQAQCLSRHLETYFLGNHYFENGAALAFVGSCFAGEQAHRWFSKGCSILREQIHEQILPDGMQFELAPGYHCRTTYVLAMLMATGNDYLKARVATHLARMVKALDLVCHPDGRIALLNDSAFGIYNEPDQLRSFCKEMSGETDIDSSASSRCFALPDAGYYGWRDQVGNYIICDVGKIGPDYIPAHAHADMFSFELSLEGQRVIVDTGVHDYEISETRRFCRSTAAHNTLEIDGQDQCEMWASFRVARRGYPQDVQWKPSKSGFSLCGWHNGYRRLPGRPVHHRCIEWDREEGLRVTDRVTSTVPVKAMSRLHLHPECKVTLSQDDRVEVGFPGGQMEVVSLHGCRLLIEDGWYFPEFGIKAHIKVIALERTGRAIELAYRLRSIA